MFAYSRVDMAKNDSDVCCALRRKITSCCISVINSQRCNM